MAVYRPNRKQLLSLIEYLKTLQYAYNYPMKELLESLYACDGFEGGVLNSDAVISVVSYGLETLVCKTANDIYICTDKYSIIKIESGALLDIPSGNTYLRFDPENMDIDEDGVTEVDISPDTALTLESTPDSSKENCKLFQSGTVLNELTISVHSSGLPQEVLMRIQNALYNAQQDTQAYSNLKNRLYPLYYIGSEGIINGVDNIVYSLSGSDFTEFEFTIGPSTGKTINIGGINSRTGMTSLYRLENELSITYSSGTVGAQAAEGTNDADNMEYLPLYYANGELHYVMQNGRPKTYVIHHNVDNIGSVVDMGVPYFRPSNDTDDTHIYIGAIGKYFVDDTTTKFFFIPQLASMSDFRVLNLLLPVYQLQASHFGGTGDVSFSLNFPTYNEIVIPIDPNANIISVKYMTPFRVFDYHTGEEEHGDVDQNPLIHKYKYANMTEKLYNHGSDYGRLAYGAGCETISGKLADYGDRHSEAAPISPYILTRVIDQNGSFAYKVTGQMAFTALGFINGEEYDYRIDTFDRTNYGSNTTVRPNVGKASTVYMQNDINAQGAIPANGMQSTYDAYTYIIMSIIYTYTNNAILNDRWIWEIGEGGVA